MSSTSSKLVELRRKTDRELPAMMQRELELGVLLAGVAATRTSPLHKKAGKIYSRMKTLLPTLAGVDQGERSRLESKLQELRTVLDQTPAKVTPRQMACSAQAD